MSDTQNERGADERWIICADCTGYIRAAQSPDGRRCYWCTPEGKAEAAAKWPRKDTEQPVSDTQRLSEIRERVRKATEGVKFVNDIASTNCAEWSHTCGAGWVSPSLIPCPECSNVTTDDVQFLISSLRDRLPAAPTTQEDETK